MCFRSDLFLRWLPHRGIEPEHGAAQWWAFGGISFIVSPMYVRKCFYRIVVYARIQVRLSPRTNALKLLTLLSTPYEYTVYNETTSTFTLSYTMGSSNNFCIWWHYFLSCTWMETLRRVWAFKTMFSTLYGAPTCWLQPIPSDTSLPTVKIQQL